MDKIMPGIIVSVIIFLTAMVLAVVGLMKKNPNIRNHGLRLMMAAVVVIVLLISCLDLGLSLSILSLFVSSMILFSGKTMTMINLGGFLTFVSLVATAYFTLF